MALQLVQSNCLTDLAAADTNGNNIAYYTIRYSIYYQNPVDDKMIIHYVSFGMLFHELCAHVHITQQR